MIVTCNPRHWILGPNYTKLPLLLAAHLPISCETHGSHRQSASTRNGTVTRLHPHLSNHLVSLYSSCTSLLSAHQPFDEMPLRKTPLSWTSVILAYSTHNLPDEHSLSSVPSPRLGRQLHALAAKTSLDTRTAVCNSLIAMYSASPDALLVFRTMPVPARNVVTWNSMIAAFPARSLTLLRLIFENRFTFDRVILLGVITTCSSFRVCSHLHCLAVKCSLDSEASAASALVKAYSRLGAGYAECYQIFLGVPEKDIVSWTGIMASCVENEPKEAMGLFREQRRKGFVPDQHVFSLAAKACAGSATERHCSAVHSLVSKCGFCNDTIVSSALIHAYARCGSILLAGNIFQHMAARDVVLWNSMIKAFATHGRGREALRAFESTDVAPDHATFAGLLTACSHGGLLDEGRGIFESMSRVYGIDPRLDHFACMVDILGRAGKLVEAELLVDKMPIEPDFVIWSLLLGACRKHRDRRIGERAARKLVELEPQRSIGYVAMFGIYCAGGSFDEADSVREEMKWFGVKKIPGLSWIEIGNHIHEFSAGGHHHRCIKDDAYVELEGIVDRLKNIGTDATELLHETVEES